MLHPTFLICPMCGERRNPEPFVATFGVTIHSVSIEEARKKAQELLDAVKEKLGSDSAESWIEGVDSLAESEKMPHYLNAHYNGDKDE